MRRHTTTYYLRRIQAAEAHLRRVQSLVRRLERIADLRYASGDIGDEAYKDKATRRWDRAHDELYLAEQKLREAEDAFDRRDWTSSDYYAWSLITDNID